MVVRLDFYSTVNTFPNRHRPSLAYLKPVEEVGQRNKHKEQIARRHNFKEAVQRQDQRLDNQRVRRINVGVEKDEDDRRQ